MERAKDENIAASLEGFSRLSPARKLGLLLALGIGTALLVGVAVWQPSTSARVDLAPGGKPDDKQVMPIQQSAALTAINPSAEPATLVRPKGGALTPNASNSAAIRSQWQLEYRRQVENDYVERVENILAPLVGADGVRAQVSADLDFAAIRQSAAADDRELQGARYRATAKEATSLSAKHARKSAASHRPESAIDGPQLADSEIKRLSVAVVVDDHMVAGKDGKIVRKPLSQAELHRMTSLVKEAVGYDVERGDSINLVNASFWRSQAPAVSPQRRAFWQQPWVRTVAKNVGVGLLVLVFFTGVLRPLLRTLASIKPRPAVGAGESERAVTADPSNVPDDESDSRAAPQCADPYDEDDLNRVRHIAMTDPKRVAQVVTRWLRNDIGSSRT